MKPTILLTFFIAFFSPIFCQTFTCGDTLLDIRDGKLYATVQIGTQCWMRENLNYGRFVASTTSASQHSDVSNNGIVEKYCQHNDSVYCDTLGGLYDWDEMMNYSPTPGQGICPSGWHLPTDGEFTTLVNYASNNGNALKELGTGMLPNGMGTNTTGFSALGGGDRDGLGVFYGEDLRFIFWTATAYNMQNAWQYTLFAEDDSIAHLNDAGKQSGFSVRCIKDVTSGLNESWPSIDWIVFPNPAMDRIQVQTMENSLEGTSKIKLISLTGDVMMEEEILQFPVELNMEGIREGVYFVQLETNGKIGFRKIIKQNGD